MYLGQTITNTLNVLSGMHVKTARRLYRHFGPRTLRHDRSVRTLRHWCRSVLRTLRHQTISVLTGKTNHTAYYAKAWAANLNHWYLRSAVAVHPAQQLVAEQRSLDALDFKQTTDQLANGGRQRINGFNASASRPNYYSLLLQFITP